MCVNDVVGRLGAGGEEGGAGGMSRDCNMCVCVFCCHGLYCGRFGVRAVGFVNAIGIRGGSVSVILWSRFWKTEATAWSCVTPCETSAES